MHYMSLRRMKWFILNYIKNGDKVLDVGSRQAENQKDTYKNILMQEREVDYCGLDIKHGKNVDLAVKDPYKWTEIQDNSFDVVISGQAFEHIEFFWEVFREMTRVLKPHGYICLIVPAHCKIHTDIDCWRFLPDGMKALAKWGNVKLIEAKCHKPSYKFVFFDGRNRINDTYGVFQK